MQTYKTKCMGNILVYIIYKFLMWVMDDFRQSFNDARTRKVASMYMYGETSGYHARPPKLKLFEILSEFEFTELFAKLQFSVVTRFPENKNVPVGSGFHLV